MNFMPMVVCVTTLGGCVNYDCWCAKCDSWCVHYEKTFKTVSSVELHLFTPIDLLMPSDVLSISSSRVATGCCVALSIQLEREVLRNHHTVCQLDHNIHLIVMHI